MVSQLLIQIIIQFSASKKVHIVKNSYPQTGFICCDGVGNGDLVGNSDLVVMSTFFLF